MSNLKIAVVDVAEVVDLFEDKKGIADFLRKHRENKQLKQYQMAKILGMSLYSYQKVEEGRSSIDMLCHAVQRAGYKFQFIIINNHK